MKRYIFCMLGPCLIFQNSESFSQNLIPNPGFEIYSQCPNSLCQVDFCVGWTTVEKTPDYFNACSPNPRDYSVPLNLVGCQPSHSGCAYIGFFSYCECPPGWREYFQAELTSTLVIGTKYYFSFNLALCDGGLNGAWTTGTNKMGFRLSTMAYPPGNDNSPSIDNFATFYTDSIITDTINWTTLRGSFIADSAYSYITFGNFFDEANIQFMNLAGFDSTSYYYIDDVCLSTDSLTCESVSDSCRTSPVNSIGENNEDDIEVFPNPFIDQLAIEMHSNEEYEVCIYSVLGQIKYKQMFTGMTSIETSMYSSGIYFFEVRNKTGVVKKGKIIKGQY